MTQARPHHAAAAYPEVQPDARFRDVNTNPYKKPSGVTSVLEGIEGDPRFTAPSGGLLGVGAVGLPAEALAQAGGDHAR